jgi:hypothetical protein
MGKKTDLIIYDKTARKSHWIAQGETKEGIEVVDYDADREEVVVKVNGIQKTLALRKPGKPTGNTARVVAPAHGFNTAAVPLPAQVGPQAPIANAIMPAVPGNAPNSSAPAVAPVPPSPPTGSPAEVQAKQETEARMLVSDLLEIGMAQRRAYEEAQRKAAESRSQNAASPNAVPQTAPAPATP